MRRLNAEHEAQDWRVHAFARDFELLDVWRFPLSIDSEIPFSEFPVFLESALADMQSGNGPAALLFRLRKWLGEIFGWDGEKGKHGDAERSMPDLAPLYEEEHEVLSQIENKTVHALMHLGRYPLSSGPTERSAWAPQLAVYVKPRGAFGRVYMAAIGPFRHLIVYPAMMRAVERAWPAYLERLADLADLADRDRSKPSA